MAVNVLTSIHLEHKSYKHVKVVTRSLANNFKYTSIRVKFPIFLSHCKYFQRFYVWISVHHKLIYIKEPNVMQLGSMFICNCNIALHVSDAFCVHLQEHLENIEAASGE